MSESKGLDSSAIGLYREIVSQALAGRLNALDKDRLRATVESLDEAEIPKRVGEAISNWITIALADVPDAEKPDVSQALAARVLDVINDVVDTKAILADDSLDQPLRELLAIEGFDPAGKVVPIQRPNSPIGDTILLTNARGEPSLISEIAAEIDSAERIDLVLAFIRWTGIRNLMGPLAKHIAKGRKVRVITTTYTGSTEAKALEKLAEIGVDVKVSYDTTTTRLHARLGTFIVRLVCLLSISAHRI